MVVFQEVFDVAAVFKAFDHHDTRSFKSSQIGLDSSAAGRDQQPVVGEFKMISLQCDPGYRLFAGVDSFDAVAGQQINSLFVTKYLGRSNDQILDVSFRRRQIIGYSSGAV
jgi:hypothetical protein